MLSGCSKHKNQALEHRDPAIQTALDELGRLNSYISSGISYNQYSDRLLTAKANIDIALQRTADQRAKEKIQRAVSFFLNAREAWKEDIDSEDKSDVLLQRNWKKGCEASDLAAEFAFADEPTRDQIDARIRMQEEKERMQEEKEFREYCAQGEQMREQMEEQIRRADEEKQARESEAEKKRKAEEQKRMAEEQERIAEEQKRIAALEHARRFAPEGTVYNLKLISVTTEEGVASIPPGTELKVINKHPDGTMRVQKDELVADVPLSAVTNDRDIVTALRADDKAKQDALQRQRNAQRTAAAKKEQEEREKQELQEKIRGLR